MPYLLGVATLILSTLAIPALTAHAQSTVPLPLASLAEGARVRITPAYGTSGLPSDAAIVGTVRRVTADSLTFAAEGASPRTLALTQIGELDASAGMRRHGKLGMGLGLAAGVLSGAMFGLASEDDFLYSREDYVAIGAVVFGVVGTVVGGLMGLAVKTDAWRPVAIGSVSDRVSLRPMLHPAQRGLGVRLSW